MWVLVQFSVNFLLVHVNNIRVNNVHVNNVHVNNVRVHATVIHHSPEQAHGSHALLNISNWQNEPCCQQLDNVATISDITCQIIPYGLHSKWIHNIEVDTVHAFAILPWEPQDTYVQKCYDLVNDKT